MKFKILTLLFAFLAVACEVNAQATLSVQGTIQRSFGGAVDDGKYSLTFKLYTQESGGTPVWSETQDDIEVIGGVYSALLGEANPLTAGFNEVYYLGIAVDGGAELIPRTRLTSAPYALSLIGQSNTFPSAGAVGVGTASPEAGNNLHVHNENGSAKVLISSADVDKTTSIFVKSGDKAGEIRIDAGSGAFAFVGDNALNLSSRNSQTHLYSNDRLKAYTTETGLQVTNNNDGDANFGIYAPGNKGAAMRLNAGDHTGYLTVNSSAFQIG
ncbi:MAG: hypothetical protein RLZ62_954, partial [Bacteroidota bacterium]